MKNASSAKVKFYCVDGPMKGYYLWLHRDATTLPFELKGWVGRYVLTPQGTLRWEEQK